MLSQKNFYNHSIKNVFAMVHHPLPLLPPTFLPTQVLCATKCSTGEALNALIVNVKIQYSFKKIS